MGEISFSCLEEAVAKLPLTISILGSEVYDIYKLLVEKCKKCKKRGPTFT